MENDTTIVIDDLDQYEQNLYKAIEKIVEDYEDYKDYRKERVEHRSGPESLKGGYTPVYAGTVLTKFFESHAGFGPLNPIIWKTTGVMGPLIMDKLPYAKQGYVLRNTLSMLFFLYTRTMDLHEPENSGFVHFDDVMKKVFTEMDASFYTAEGVPKINMIEAIDKGLITTPLSTQDVIRLKRPDFNREINIIKDALPGQQIYREAFPIYFIQQLASNNYYSKENLKENDQGAAILEAFDQKEVTDSMILEHNIVKETIEKWNEYLIPFHKANREKNRFMKEESMTTSENENITTSENENITTSEVRKRS